MLSRAYCALCSSGTCHPGLDQSDDTYHNWLKPDSGQDHEWHRHVDHQPGHLFRGPGVDEHIPHKPIDHKQAKTRGSQQAAHDTGDTEDKADLFVEWDKQQVIIPGLLATCDLLLLQPIVQSLPDAIANTTTDIGEDDGKQHQEDGPPGQQSKKPVRPGHSENAIQQRMAFAIKVTGNDALSRQWQFPHHLTNQDTQHIKTQQNPNPGYDSCCLIFQTLHIGIRYSSILRIGGIDGKALHPTEEQASKGCCKYKVEQYREGHRSNDQPVYLAIANIACRSDDQQQCEAGHIDIFAREA